MQVDAGAEVIVTQPPLLWNKFDAWMNEIQRQAASNPLKSGLIAIDSDCVASNSCRLRICLRIQQGSYAEKL